MQRAGLFPTFDLIYMYSHMHQTNGLHQILVGFQWPFLFPCIFYIPLFIYLLCTNLVVCLFIEKNSFSRIIKYVCVNDAKYYWCIHQQRIFWLWENFNLLQEPLIYFSLFRLFKFGKFFWNSTFSCIMVLIYSQLWYLKAFLAGAFSGQCNIIWKLFYCWLWKHIGKCLSWKSCCSWQLKYSNIMVILLS